MSGTLTHSPADVVRYLLIALSQGALPTANGSWPVYCDQEPSTPDNAITVYDTQGRDSGRVMTNGERQEHHGIQVRVRSANPVDGFTKARAIAVALDTEVDRDSVTISATSYTVQNVSRTTDVLSLGKESPTSKRNLFTINAVVSLRQN